MFQRIDGHPADIEDRIGVTDKMIISRGVAEEVGLAVIGKAASLRHDTNSKIPKDPKQERRFAAAGHRISETAFAKL